MTKRKAKMKTPMDPAEIARKLAEARRNPALWGHNLEALQLVANSDVVHEGESRKNEARAMRWDVFTLLHQRSGLRTDHLEAVRRLQKDIAVLHKSAGSSGSTGGPRTAVDPLQAWMTEDFSIPRLLAALRLYGRPGETLGVLARMTPWCARLVWRLAAPEAIDGKRPNWRHIARQTIGDIEPTLQVRRIKEACCDLFEAYGKPAEISVPVKALEVA